MDWSLQNPGNDLSSIVQKAVAEGAQIVTSHGERTAVVLSADEYDRLVGQRPTIVDHILSGPNWDADLVADIGRRAPVGRPLED